MHVHETITYPMADVSGSSPLTSSRTLYLLFILWMLTSPFIRGPCMPQRGLTEGGYL
jgi:hypothetical protein